ncbi:MAG TPA: CoB--CoM heterodisulfide reductase iron-sulfur subunit A family protein, partial [Deltaproteobacteria bacterium]|nr:CoB--CoM heterodisulfide reductase iron-sulfur subunit A family protein [Deltaproteobacteria bacterium]
MSEKKNNGAVLVLGGGVAGIHAALQLADEGYYVYLVEKKSTIGGMMPQLSRTFGECFCCKIYPQAYGCLWNPNIEILTLSEVEKIDGKAGNFTVTVNQKPRFVNEAVCSACGKCASVCPVEVSDEAAFQSEKRKAIYIEHPFAVPMTYAVDADNCSFIKD